ncbi:MAG: VWA domain-containing protein [Solirubrobacterales bacterium]|nr:VWA domain-containing protein [Solirubrobacterales bacterium]
MLALLGVFSAEASARKCLAAPEVALIFDDSGSMRDTDPLSIRAEALRMFLDRPSTQRMTVGAVEFGSRGGPLFSPGVVSRTKRNMLASLRRLDNRGYRGSGDQTFYNSAFRASRRQQPHADARIFLTDGDSNDRIRLGLVKGTPTYVIGLNVTKGDRTGYGKQLHRIARVSRGRYFPLRHRRDRGASPQIARLQPVINRISATLGCSKITKTVRVTARHRGQRFGPFRVRFGGRSTIQILATWPWSGTAVRFVSCRVVDRSGRIVADLTGRGRRVKLRVRTYPHQTSKRIVIKRPRHGWKLIFVVKIVKITRRTPVTVQIETGGGEDAFRPIPPPSPPPPPVDNGRRVITVYNQVTNGMGMVEDPTPTRLTTKPWAFCTSRGCNVGGTERRTGQTYDAAVCQTFGERITNGNDHSPADDANPNRFESTRYYGVQLTDGTFGLISEVWINAADRGGLGLPAC